jgi:hypothetical protein
VNPARKAVEKKAAKRPDRDELLQVLLKNLDRRKPVFHCYRTQGSVRLDMNGSTVGYVEVDQASANVGLALKLKRHWGGLAAPVIYAKDGQHERKKVAVICAFLMYQFDDRPSEDRLKERVYRYSDPKNWYDSFSNDLDGELTEALAAQRAVTKACPYLIDVFHEVSAAMKSARGEDVAEAVARVRKELPFLTKALTVEQWTSLFHETVVDEVHDL